MKMKMSLIAKASGDCLPCEYEVLPADRYLKEIIPTADYYCEIKFGVLAFIPYDEIDEDDDDEEVEESKFKDHRQFYYLINGKKYKTCYTSHYIDLVKFCKKKKNKFEQLQLF